MVEQYTITLSTGLQDAKKRKLRQKKQTNNAWYYLGLVGQIGYVIALPIAGGAIIGSLAGNTLLGICIGFLLSVFGFIRVIQKIIK